MTAKRDIKRVLADAAQVDQKASQDAFQEFLEGVEIDDELADKIQKRIKETPTVDDDD
jgi:hypothetical protein